jgi:hypothetical protein
MNIKPLNVHLILHPDNQGWVIEKFALKLKEYLPATGVNVTLSERQRPEVDLNHWMSYAFANEPQHTRATMFITHIDDPYKVALIRTELASGIDLGICMSRHSMQQLIELGAPQQSLCAILPAHDGLPVPRRICIGIATRLYADGRKREKFLVRLCRRMSLESFRFEIFGSGWESVIEELRSAGAEVGYFPGTPDYRADYQLLLQHLYGFDYYLYTGMDEGSLGTLDAIAAGVPTIVTAQGFHLDLADAITHFFVDYEELEAIFRRLRRERAARLAAAARLTWPLYAQRHADIWRGVIAGKSARVLPDPGGIRGSIAENANVRVAMPRISFWLRVLRPRRLLSALGHTRRLKRLRDAWRNFQRTRGRDDRSA